MQWCRFLLTSLLLSGVVLPPLVEAASPSLGGITPRGVQRGTQAVVLFNGVRLSDAQQVVTYQPGLSVAKLEVVNDNQVKATLQIAPDCPLGEHALRLRTATGISELRTLWVGPYPIVEEKESNSDFASPQKVPLNVTVHGVVTNEDVDYFAVELKKGQRLSVEVEGMRLGTTFFDPYIAILDSKRFELASSDDTPLHLQDGHCSIVAPEDGTYIVQIRETSYGGNGSCVYRLHIGSFPRPAMAYPAGGRVNEEIEVRFLGDPTGDLKQKFKLPATPNPDFAVFPQDAGGIAPSGNRFRVSDFPNVLEVAPNQNHAQATVGTLPCAFNGIISQPGEADHFRFTAKKGQVYDFRCHARRLGSPLDPVMTLFAFNGGGLVANDDSGGPDSYFRYTIPNDGEYVLQITDHLRKGGPNYVYRVEVTPVQPSMTLSVPYAVQFSQERQVVTVPKGNRNAVLLSVARSDFGGEVQLNFEQLPQQMTWASEPIAANMTIVPVVLQAAADAPTAGTLANIVGKHADPKVNIPSRFVQSAQLVYGPPNNTVYWQKSVDRLAVAVGEPAPFRVSIVEPKVPLVQNGSMQLKIVAERQAGFKGPITVQPLYNPPGIGSAGAVTIPADQNEVFLPMNAAPNAQVRKWKYAVLASADAGKGPIWVSSQLATIEVAPPYLAITQERGAVEQGKATQMFCKVSVVRPFEGNATVKLLGLPAKVTTTDQTITKETQEFAFPLTTEPTAPPGTHRNIFCQVIITENGEPIVHNVGGTELRIDVPLPPKPNEPPKPVVQQPPPMPMPHQPPMKRLSRLEQLRLEQEEREKAANPAQTLAPKKN